MSMKKNKLSFAITMAFGFLISSASLPALAQAAGINNTSSTSSNATPAPAAPTGPVAPGAGDKVVKDFAKETKIPLGTAIQMTERLREENAKKQANPKDTAPITRSTTGNNNSTTGANSTNSANNAKPALPGATSAPSTSPLPVTPVAPTLPTPASTQPATPANTGASGAKPASSSNTNNTSTSASSKTSAITKESTESAYINKVISDLMANQSDEQNVLRTINALKARAELAKAIQETREAEAKLKQPLDEKKSASSSVAGAGAGIGGGALPGGSTLSASGNVVANPFNPVLRAGAAPQGPANAQAPASLADVTPMVNKTPLPGNIAVYSIIGFDNQYSAKVTLDNGKSIYTVKRGDILPDGQMVTEINQYYIIVKEQMAVGRPLADAQRVYATGRPLQSGAAANQAANTNATTQGAPARSNTTVVAPPRAGMLALPSAQ